MSLNKKILEKAKEKTKDDANLRDLLSKLLEFESGRDNKQYEVEYTKLLEEHVK